MESPDLRWFEDTDRKCGRCGKRATGILRGVRNESYGPHCKRCAEKRLKDSERVRRASRRAPTPEDTVLTTKEGEVK